MQNLKGRGRKRKTTIRVDRLIQRKLKCDRRKSSRMMKVELEQHLGVSISERTIKRRANERGLFGRVARKRPYVNKANRLKRLNFAKTMSNKPLDFWNTVLWTDESKFNLFGSDGKVMVWRSKKKEFHPKCIVPTVKYGGGSVMVWGCFSRSDVDNLYFLDRNMNMQYYVDILDQNLIQSAKHLRLGRQFTFQHDNDPKYTSGMAKEWLKKNKINVVLPWASFSPDMNPIEHLWYELDRRIRKRQPTSTADLQKVLLEKWNDIGKDVTEKLINSMPNSLHECINIQLVIDFA